MNMKRGKKNVFPSVNVCFHHELPSTVHSVQHGGRSSCTVAKKQKLMLKNVKLKNVLLSTVLFTMWTSCNCYEEWPKACTPF